MQFNTFNTNILWETKGVCKGETIKTYNKHDFADYKLPLFEKFEDKKYTGLQIEKYINIPVELVS